ncbi:LysR family transcriptional regulator [Caballeronia sordidicola]|uniref:LysR family transcriptional regulator n=1 Tax=Caballeronia sordidicola TaxID=196367 RepID=UPI000A388B45|nr:LysR family transcriptional regulator [Caballeronia sordidicola]
MNLYGIDLNLLVAFDALMTERSVTKAGKRIGRTQPAMSAALARLRVLFRDELFVRSQEGLQATPRAMDLAEPLSRALADIQVMLGVAEQFAPETSTVSFKIGLAEHPTYMLLPHILDCVQEKAPAVDVRVRSFAARDEAIALLDAGDVDVTVGVSTQAAPGRIFSVPLFEERFVCVVKKGHPVSGRPLDLETFLGLSHLLVSPEGDDFGHVDTALAEKGLKRRLALTLSQTYAAPAIIARSNMIATLMKGVITTSQLEDQLCEMQPPLPVEPVSFVMCWHRRTNNHLAQQWLRECIVSQSKLIGLTRSP